MSGRLIELVSLTTLILTANIGLAMADQSRLDKIHRDIVTKYSDVKQLGAVELQSMKDSAVIVFDVREEEEFAVSHIGGAVRVDPDIELTEFANKYSTELSGKTIVFYCSVGRRSSELASQLAGMLKTNGAVAAFNLSGGIFRWHNERRPLMSLNKQETIFIHPYNFYWGRLIDDRAAIRYKP
jgi:rhodanese-related sulfurtransferase